MADAVFSACFLNMVLRNADIVGMANFAPIINTRGCIYSHDEGVVLRSTYHVFDLYVNLMGDEILDMYGGESPLYSVTAKDGTPLEVEQTDVLATRRSADGKLAVSLVNKHASQSVSLTLEVPCAGELHVHTLCGKHIDDYNDVDRNTVVPFENDGIAKAHDGLITVTLPPHSVNILTIG